MQAISNLITALVQPCAVGSQSVDMKCRMHCRPVTAFLEAQTGCPYPLLSKVPATLLTRTLELQPVPEQVCECRLPQICPCQLIFHDHLDNQSSMLEGRAHMPGNCASCFQLVLFMTLRSQRLQELQHVPKEATNPTSVIVNLMFCTQGCPTVCCKLLHHGQALDFQ